ncbi:hypothetical protein AMS68_000888 [Peltaster fructicola]|uniref:Nuclear control of ATPase protein 2 n=1 Tax=Peltaster fructicola TaxID=286661 RepID=A0A6H0XL62_9PEZI|nr:hypothetical protein AMS68_000888 [Peltaster fructicola]
MSFVLDSVRRIDAQLDRLQLHDITITSPTLSRVSTWSSTSRKDAGPKVPSRLLALQASIRELSVSGTTDEKSLLRPARIHTALKVLSEEVVEKGDGSRTEDEQYEQQLEWLLVLKATALVYGLVVKSILDQAVGLADDVWYWDEIMSSRRWTAVYSLQTSPLRLWHWSSAVWSDVKAKGGNLSFKTAGQDAQASLTQSWTDFYGLVRRVIQERSVQEFQKQALTPLTRIRGEIRQNQKALKNVRLRNANALGVLLGEGLANETVHGRGLVTPNGAVEDSHKWRRSVARNVALMEAILSKVNDESITVDKFDSVVAELTHEATLGGQDTDASDERTPQAVAARVNELLRQHLPAYAQAAQTAKQAHGRPSRLIRYWPAIVLGVLSSSTVLRVVANRKAEIVQWIQDFGTTTIDFWQNWVVEPLSKVIKTIRHDEDSQLSLVSKRSLEGDRDSLERMVVDFAIDRPENSTGSSAKLTDSQIADIRSKVKEGDLTPVLKAYERDLRSPFMGTIRGDLIRALLIQVQKTKVDVEVAIGGIDNLLKSQELVFGFVGLTPGILVTYFALRYIRESFSEKRGSQAARKEGRLLRQLRNIDRILSNSPPTDFGELYYKDQGLLLCEAHVLQDEARKIMPSQIFRDFAEDVEELCDVRTGVERQKNVTSRLRWAYGKYLRA